MVFILFFCNSINTNSIKEYFLFINYINFAYAFDNIYYYITHVSMKSIMLNQKSNTFIKFYILVSENIYEQQKPVISRICEEHKNCNITFLILKKQFKEFSPTGRIKRTTAIFYRLILQNLIPTEKKILYFDCDTIIYRDLNIIYNYNITNKYYIGRYEGKPLKKYRKKLKDFINSGVILINLELLRKDNIFPKIYRFLRKYNGHLSFLDQDAINVVCNKKNGFFPSYYFGNDLCNLNNIIKINMLNKKQNHNIKNIAEPYIFHFTRYEKPWHGISKNGFHMVCCDFFIRFYEYAKKSSYYFVILETFKIYNKILILKK